MELPYSDKIAVQSLSRVFKETTNSYKFFWFLAILDQLQKTGEARIAMSDLSLQMMASVWYPLDYYKLSFGSQDQFREIAKFISSHLDVNTKKNAPDLVQQLRTGLSETYLSVVYQRIKSLLRWVPYRFIRPFFEQETKGLPDGHVNNEIIRLAGQNSKAPYRFDGDFIIIHDVWGHYFQQYQYILRGFIHWHLVRFLQKNNPNVSALSEKLERPVDRDFKIAKPFWTKYLTQNPGLKCIYSSQLVTKETLSIDHYLPFSFVAHDQLWNLVPTTKVVNSAKNDRLPDTDSYFQQFARLQYDTFQFFANAGDEKKLEDYSIVFRESTEAIKQRSFEWFQERLSHVIMPQLQTAQNMGFSYPFIYNKK